jgi:hypothetical protein
LVTGLGSINANALALAWGDLFTSTTTALSPSTNSTFVGNSVTFTATVSPSSATGTVGFYNNGSANPLGTSNVSGGTASLTVSTLPAGTNSVVAIYQGINAPSTSSPAAVTVIQPDFTLSATALTPSSISAGQSTSATLTLTPVNGSTQTINFTNSTSSNTGSSPGSCTAGSPTGALCTFNPTSITLDGIHSQNITLVITTLPNMASGSSAITVTGTASGTGGTSHTAGVNLTVTPTTESFTLATTNGATFAVPVGGTASVQLAVSSSNGFVNGTSSTTVLPLNYSCAGLPGTAEITCQFTPNTGQQVSATAVTLNLVTTPRTVKLDRPFDRSRGIFYALLLPGLFGILFIGGSRTRTSRLLSLIVLVGCSTLWLGACGGSSSALKNAGTPPSTYSVTVTATTGGASPMVATSPAIALTVTP